MTNGNRQRGFVLLVTLLLVALLTIVVTQFARRSTADALAAGRMRDEVVQRWGDLSLTDALGPQLAAKFSLLDKKDSDAEQTGQRQTAEGQGGADTPLLAATQQQWPFRQDRALARAAAAAAEPTANEQTSQAGAGDDESTSGGTSGTTSGGTSGEAENQDLTHFVTPARYEITVQGVSRQWRIRVDDENAKLNLNLYLWSESSPARVREYLARKLHAYDGDGGATVLDAYHQRQLSLPAASSWRQLNVSPALPDPDASLKDHDQRPVNFATLWGDGTLNWRRAGHEAIRLACSDLLGAEDARKLVSAISGPDSVSLAKALQLLKAPKGAEEQLKQRLADKSGTFSINIVMSDARRSPPSTAGVYVVIDQPQKQVKVVHWERY